VTRRKVIPGTTKGSIKSFACSQSFPSVLTFLLRDECSSWDDKKKLLVDNANMSRSKLDRQRRRAVGFDYCGEGDSV
jgi:hypothetical protein